MTLRLDPQTGGLRDAHPQRRRPCTGTQTVLVQPDGAGVYRLPKRCTEAVCIIPGHAKFSLDGGATYSPTLQAEQVITLTAPAPRYLAEMAITCSDVATVIATTEI